MNERTKVFFDNSGMISTLRRDRPYLRILALICFAAVFCMATGCRSGSGELARNNPAVAGSMPSQLAQSSAVPLSAEDYEFDHVALNQQRAEAEARRAPRTRPASGTG